MNYFDTSYTVRLYFEEPGFEEVRSLKDAEPWACALHGKAESAAAFHRKFRDGVISASKLHETLQQFEADCLAGEFRWLPVTESAVNSLAETFGTLPADCFLRAGDAMHLACARDYGFTTIYSNDKNLLAAAKHFGIRGRNVIGRRS